MKKISASKLRTITVLAFLALTALGLGFKTGTGTLSAFGYKTISAVCPLGAIEAMVASRALLPWAVVSILVVVLFGTLLGRVFCAWVCPVPMVRGWVTDRAKEEGKDLNQQENAGIALQDVPTSELHQDGKPFRISIDTRHFVLGGALVSTAVFGFPVFCLICPIGLTFGLAIGIWRLFQFNEPSWTLLIFPAVLALELVACRSWCRKFCPLGALLSVLSSLNVFARPRVNPAACLRISKGMDCSVCKSVCPEGIDLHHVRESQPLSECTKCRECSDCCKAGAISFPFLSKQ